MKQSNVASLKLQTARVYIAKEIERAARDTGKARKPKELVAVCLDEINRFTGRIERISAIVNVGPFNPRLISDPTVLKCVATMNDMRLQRRTAKKILWKKIQSTDNERIA